MVRALLLAALLAAPPLAAAIELADLGKEVRLIEAVIAPEGGQVAVVGVHQDFVDNRLVRSLQLVDVSTGAIRELAIGRTSVRSPQWSPRGDRLAWLDASAGGEAAIHVLSLQEGLAKAVTLSNVGGAVNSFRWSPDGKSFAFLTDASSAAREPFNRSFEIIDGSYLSKAASVTSQLWLVAADGGEARRLSSDDENVTAMEWQQGGRSLGYISEPARGVDSPKATLSIIEVQSGTRRVVTEVPTPGGNVAVLEVLPSSPDGRLMSYARSRSGNLYSQRRIYLAATNDAKNRDGAPALHADGRDATPALDASFHGMAWVAEGRTLALSANQGTRTALWLQPLEGKSQRLDTGAVSEVRALSASRNGTLAFIGSEPRRAAEIYVMTSARSKPQRLTQFNAWSAALELGRSETVTWTVDGLALDGVLTYPPKFDAGRKYPLVLDLHGGPTGTSLDSFGGFHQLLATQGWLVFRPNFRGSDNAGERVQSAIVDDLGEGPGRDVMAGIAALQARGIVDDTRIAVSGWSYGGYLTAWLISRYPQTWRAAVAGAAITDWRDQYHFSDLTTSIGHAFGGSPWVEKNAENYWRQSPMANATRIRTPTLILANTGDERVPITHSYKLYRALKDSGTPVQFVAYPISGHWPSDPVHQRDMYGRWLGWIATAFAGDVR
ncbi:alpha/beta hydrolase family protein [Steroidobacter sp.]|uniref:S9 family peptidase n=1 Tax=Steroidobacter sp. TaxID=1978227 RepID=UPI001A3D6C43|nr:S9 family peptidase [Steroidobacter sp.]MBL8265987.1 S9 family peptidase [Steroidobacter sp.]